MLISAVVAVAATLLLLASALFGVLDVVTSELVLRR